MSSAPTPNGLLRSRVQAKGTSEGLGQGQPGAVISGGADSPRDQNYLRAAPSVYEGADDLSGTIGDDSAAPHLETDLFQKRSQVFAMTLSPARAQ